VIIATRCRLSSALRQDARRGRVPAGDRRRARRRQGAVPGRARGSGARWWCL